MDSKLSPMINLVADSLWEEITKVNPAFEEYAKTAEVCYFRSEDASKGVFQGWIRDAGDDTYPICIRHPDTDFSAMKKLDFLVGSCCSVFVSASSTFISTPMCKDEKLRLCIRYTNSHGWSESAVDIVLMHVEA
ncbi:unnamed protein product [Oikopleura dioica]|uniref:Uncharacterized protein n=1 Tax=Oikopleura dioica TaxID=34765 RepID=E4YBL1_OIKDI|nr:unnamed protein product [Oikopleura dioica]